ncbi:MAG: hypothetical protein JEZ12_23885 [Desulfobacterium sp.]|nr:hypothetical protein [Desulfobacterium sp.]
MNIDEIKTLLSNGDVPSEKVNPIINSLSEEDLSSLSEQEKKCLYEILNKMLLLMQDLNSGAHLDNPQKAEILLNSISDY